VLLLTNATSSYGHIVCAFCPELDVSKAATVLRGTAERYQHWNEGCAYIYICNRPVIATRRRSQSFCGIREVNLLPYHGGIATSRRLVTVAVVALEISSQRIVKPVLFKDQRQGRIVGPLKTKETGHEILGRLEHSVLRGCPSDDFGG